MLSHTVLWFHSHLIFIRLNELIEISESIIIKMIMMCYYYIILCASHSQFLTVVQFNFSFAYRCKISGAQLNISSQECWIFSTVSASVTYYFILFLIQFILSLFSFFVFHNCLFICLFVWLFKYVCTDRNRMRSVKKSPKR